MKKIIDTVDFDYPSCGGYEVFEDKDRFSVRKYSNYTGSYTHRYWSIPKTTASSGQSAIVFIETSPEAENYITRKGHKVQ